MRASERLISGAGRLSTLHQSKPQIRIADRTELFHIRYLYATMCQRDGARDVVLYSI